LALAVPVVGVGVAQTRGEERSAITAQRAAPRLSLDKEEKIKATRCSSKKSRDIWVFRMLKHLDGGVKKDLHKHLWVSWVFQPILDKELSPLLEFS
jgi:hypothetical protein